MGLRAGAAFVDILPRVGRNFGPDIDRQLEGPAASAGRKAGSAAGDSFATSFRGATRKVGESFAKAGALATVGLTAPVVALGKQAFEAASDLNETISKSNTIFGAGAAAMEAWADGAARALGQSKRQALDSAATFGNLFLQLGIGGDTASGMSKKMVELASDFASLHNADISEVLLAQTAAFRGEFDAVQRFVPTINAAAVEQEGLRLGLKSSTKELTVQDKAIATHSLLVSGAGKATGDFTRNIGGAANQQKVLTALWEDSKAKLGQALLPIFAQVAGVVAKLAERFSGLSPQMQKIVLAVGGVLAVAGPLAAALGGIVTVAGLIASPVGLIVAGVAALAAGLVYAYTHVESFRNLVSGVGAVIADFVVPRVQQLVELFRTRIIPAVQEAARIIGEALKPKLDELRAAFERNRPEIELAIAVVGRFMDKVYETYAKVAEFLLPVLAKVAAFFAGQFIENIGVAIEGLGKLVRGIQTLVNVAGAFGDVFGFLRESFKAALNFIIRGWNGLDFKIPGFSVGPVGFPGFTLGMPDIPELRDKGGSTVPGRSYLIGPGMVELFSPGRGHIMPPDKLAAALAGTAAAQPSNVTLKIDGPHSAGLIQQVELGGQILGFLLPNTGRA